MDSRSIAPLPRTERFYVGEPASYPDDSIFTVYYHGHHFGHTWKEAGSWGPEYAGKWTFNRGRVCIDAKWWPAQYHHETLAGLLQHLEDTFPRE
jgi:hypothetical protein